MGKGGGYVPSKKKKPHPDGASNRGISNEIPAPIEDREVSDAVAIENPAVTNLRIFIVFYSMYGHVEKLAMRMKKEVDGVEGVEAELYRVQETLSPDVLDHMKVPPKEPKIPEITVAELEKADGVLFGFPTRYGCMTAQMKGFFDSTGQLWKEQKFAGKLAGFFVSTGTQGGGHVVASSGFKRI